MGEEDLELRRIRLRKMRQLLAARTQTDQQQQPKREDPVEELKRYLDERGNEVLEEAASLNRALTERVAEALSGPSGRTRFPRRSMRATSSGSSGTSGSR
jgi:hypothetical protein